ncbi:MAG: hypothetical protein IJB92_00855 [Clostridia bacterium]|nr:hypothetical protein [Clostridia bacterium]
MHKIGIDIGTTTICAVVLDENLNQLECVTAKSGDILPACRSFERMQDASFMLKTAAALIDGFLDKYEVGKIGISCQMHGILYLDASLRPISPLYNWQDGRAGEKNGSSTYLDEIFSLTSHRLSAGYGLATHYYNLKNSLVPKGAALICTIGDALCAYLTGVLPKMHVSNAASLGLYSLRDFDFDAAALRALNISRDMLPEVTKTAAPVGSYRGAEVFCALGDNQCSFLGSVSSPDSDVLVNIGTGGQVSWKITSADIPKLLPKCASLGLEIRPLDGDDFISVGSTLCAGRAYALLARLFAQIRGESDLAPSYELMNSLALDQGASLSIDTRFSGSRAEPSLLGSISDISESTFTAGALVRGVISGISNELLSYYIPSPNHTRIILSGNGARKNPALCREISQKFSLPFSLSPHAEEAARGAAV